MKKILISGTGGNFSKGLSEYFLGKGYSLWQPGDALDMFVYIIKPPGEEDQSILNDLDFDKLQDGYENIAIEMIKEVSDSLDLFGDPEKARLCFVNYVESSVNMANYHKGDYGRMINAACNMAIRIMFNRLRPLGYTFRVFAAQDGDNPLEASYAAEYFLTDRSLEEEEPQIRSDENRFVMRNMYEEEIPW